MPRGVMFDNDLNNAFSNSRPKAQEAFITDSRDGASRSGLENARRDVMGVNDEHGRYDNFNHIHGKEQFTEDEKAVANDLTDGLDWEIDM